MSKFGVSKAHSMYQRLRASLPPLAGGQAWPCAGAPGLEIRVKVVEVLVALEQGVLKKVGVCEEVSAEEASKFLP